MNSTSKPTQSEIQRIFSEGVETETQNSGDRSGGMERAKTDNTLSIQGTNLRVHIRHWMQECRQSTIALFDGMDSSLFCHHVHPDFSPIGWHLGHIAYTESLWLLEHLAKQPCQFPQYRCLFAADGLPKSERVHLPTLTETLDYLSCIRQRVFEYLGTTPIQEQEPIWRFLLQHESQHCETIALLLEFHKTQTASPSLPLSPSPPLPLPPSKMVCIPAGHFICGSNAIDALDNERPAHERYLDTYWIDRYPVTCQQYQQFIAAGGYQNSRWWSEEGWAWRQTNEVTQPLYWKADPAWDNHPVSGVSWYEADAYAHFVGKRLPTEFEWEKAARWNPITEQSQTFPWGEAEPMVHQCNHGHAIGYTSPVDAYPAGESPSGCQDMLGNVWEWTSSWFDGYDGFKPFPYRGYSQAYFDGQHRVLKGGSWATRKWAMRGAFRNWYHPHVREILAGFRCASSSAE